MTNTVLTLLGLAAVPLMGAAIFATAAGGKALHDWLSAKAQTNRWFKAGLELEDLTLAIVQDIENNERDALVRKSGGELTAIDAAQLKELAVTRLKAVLAAKGPDTLRAMFGDLIGTPALETVISGKVEQAVAKVSAATGSSSPR